MCGNPCEERKLWRLEHRKPVQVFDYRDGSGSTTEEADGSVRISIPAIGTIELYPVGQDRYQLDS